MGGGGWLLLDRGALIGEGRLIQPVTLKRGRLLDKKRFFESGSLIELLKGRVKGSHAQISFPLLKARLPRRLAGITGKK